jgi:hypothetical protein
MSSASQISERWRLVNDKYSQSTHSMVRVIRAIMPDDMAGRTNKER